MRQRTWHLVLILSVSVSVMFSNLGGPRLWDQDETRNAGCALEMMQRGDWVVPIFNDQLRDAKPVLLYWLIMSAYALFGVGEFAARFWSAVAAVGTVLATYCMGRRLFHPTAALWSAVILSTSLMFTIAGRAATPDSVLIFFSTLSMSIYVGLAFPPQGRVDTPQMTGNRSLSDAYFPRRWWPAALMYLPMGFGVLAKGPIGVLLPTAVIGMFLLIVRLPPRPRRQPVAALHPPAGGPAPGIVAGVLAGLAIAQWAGLPGVLLCAVALAAWFTLRGRHGWLCLLRPFEPRHFLRTCRSMRLFTAAAIVLAIALPWYLLVGLRTEGDFLHGFFVKEHFGRATSPMERHDGSPLFYGFALLVGFLPWSVFAVPLVMEIIQRTRRRQPQGLPYLFLSCWVGVYVAIFTLASTKLPSYVTPCYPALALLTGSFIHLWTQQRCWVSRAWPAIAIGVLGGVGGIIMVAIALVASFKLPGAEWIAAVGLIPLLTAVVSLWLLKRAGAQAAAQSFAAGAVVLSLILFALITNRIDEYRYHHVLLAEIDKRSGCPEVAHLGPLEPSWVYYGGRPIRPVTCEPIGDGTAARSAPWKPHPAAEFEDFCSGKDAFVITTSLYLEQIGDDLPAGVEVLAEIPYFMKQERLLLLGHADRPDRLARQSDAGLQ